jgi:hypothetical protein
MFQKFIDILTNPDNPNFWQAITILVTILLAAASKISINRIGKTSRILLDSIIEQYLEWVKVRSKSQEVSNESIRDWIIDYGGGIKTGRSYLVFKKFIRKLNKEENKHLSLPDEETYKVWVNKYDGSTKLSRQEW